MRMYTVSLKGEPSVSINFRGSLVILKEGDEHFADSLIYKFYSRYFVPSIYYTPYIKEEKVSEPQKITTVKNLQNNVNDFFDDINTNEKDVIIETETQD